MVTGGHVRVNGSRVAKASHGIAAGDVLTFAQGHEIRVVRIEGFAQRRGPAREARMLYSDLAEPEDTVPPLAESGGNRRPTKRERRKLDFIRRQELE